MNKIDLFGEEIYRTLSSNEEAYRVRSSSSNLKRLYFSYSQQVNKIKKRAQELEEKVKKCNSLIVSQNICQKAKDLNQALNKMQLKIESGLPKKEETINIFKRIKVAKNITSSLLEKSIELLDSTTKKYAPPSLYRCGIGKIFDTSLKKIFGSKNVGEPTFYSSKIKNVMVFCKTIPVRVKLGKDKEIDIYYSLAKIPKCEGFTIFGSLNIINDLESVEGYNIDYIKQVTNAIKQIAKDFGIQK